MRLASDLLLSVNCIEVINLGLKDEALAADVRDRAVDALESGKIIFLPNFGFPVADAERVLFSTAVIGRSKNVSYDPRTGVLRGTAGSKANVELLQQMISRFADLAQKLVLELLSSYKGGLIRARTSFRPVAIEGRSLSWRKDDTRLHVDSFPSSPSHGKRILRVFTNVNPDGLARVWRVGEPFERMAARFVSSIRRPIFGSSSVMKLLRITKSRRTLYDHLMLELHNRMKVDDRYQAEVEQTELEFPAGSTWLAFTDQVSHAAMRGQYQLEQTFLVPVGQLRNEGSSPLRVLEQLTGWKLV
jgi:hypothetical protein